MTYLVTGIYQGKQVWCVIRGGLVMWTTSKSEATELSMIAAMDIAKGWNYQYVASDK